MTANRSLSVLMAGGLCLPCLSPDVGAEPTVQLDKMVVHAPAADHETNRILPADIQGGSSLNAAELATQIPGVTSVRRGANAAEPVIRGLGWERVVTHAGSHSLYGSCPSRMDPPATYVSPESLQGVRVVKGIPSVTLGPGATGGILILETDFDRGPDAEPGLTRHADALWNAGRDGFSSSLQIRGGPRDVDIKAGATVTEFGDYDSADGTSVPADISERGVAASLGWRPDTVSRVFGHAQLKQERHVDFPSLPMDTDHSDSTILTLGYRNRPDSGSLNHIEVNLGYSRVDHVMNNEDKSNRSKLLAETPSEAHTASLKIESAWSLSDEKRLTIGADGEYLERDATRTRVMRATGATFHDAIWPDVDRTLLGVFGELDQKLSGTVTLRTGLRVDAAASDAGKADEMITLGPGNAARISDRYVEFNGPGAREVDRDDVLYSGNILAEWAGDGAWSSHIGVGRTERYPAVTELYFAFAPAPGGFQVGNPDLDTETKYELSTGLRFEGEALAIELSVFASRIEDYALQTALQHSDLNGDSVPDLLRGFRNVDAELYGGEVAANWMIADHWSLPVSLAYVRGRNTDDDRDLPEIPPFSGDAGLHYQSGTDTAGWVNLGMRFALRQTNIDSAFPEDETPSFTVFHLRGGRHLTPAVAIEAGVENLLDEDYHEHLTRETILPDGDLKPGDEIPGIGRYVYAKATCTF